MSYIRYGDEWKKHVSKLPKGKIVEMFAELGNDSISPALALEEAKKLLNEARDLFDGKHSLCDDANSEEWIWKWKVRYYFEETNIPVHPMPSDMVTK